MSTAARTARSVVEGVDWQALKAVRLRVREDGAAFVLQAHGARRVVALAGAPDGLYERLQELPGFDTEVLLRALAGLPQAEFVCWRAC